MFILVPIVVNNFTLYYTHAKTRTKLPKDVVKDLRKKGSTKRKLAVRTSDIQVKSLRHVVLFDRK